MKLGITTNIAVTIALITLSTASVADWVEGLPGDKKSPTQDSSNTNNNNTDNQSVNQADINKTTTTVKIKKNNEQTDNGGKVLANEKGNTTPNVFVNPQNTNNGSGRVLNRLQTNNNYPIRAMNPMRYGYAPAPNGYYNMMPMMPMMPPPQIMPPLQRQMFPVMTYEQQQAQMDMIRQRFEAMAQRVADAQKALAEAHQKAQKPSQTAIVVPQSIATEVTISDVTEKQ